MRDDHDFDKCALPPHSIEVDLTPVKDETSKSGRIVRAWPVEI